MPRNPFVTVVLLVAGFSAGCSPTYVLRAGYEEARILWAREPIAEILAEHDLDAERRAKLELVLDVRAFARERVGLTVAGSYASVSRIDDPAVVHVVSAAERFRLVPYTWWFPVVGRVPYKGFFDIEGARDAARRLEADGYDTYVRPAGGFSTLGWFDDPLMSTQLRLDDADLANLILHELLHTTSYTPGQAAFAESFATFVGYRGAMDFFRERGEEDRARAIEDEWIDTVAFSAFLDVVETRLASAYAGEITLDERQAIFADLQQRWAEVPQRTGRYAAFAKRPLNNAVILQIRLYHQDLAVFDRVWRRFGGDLAATVAAIVAASEAGGDAFVALADLAGEPRAESSGLQGP